MLDHSWAVHPIERQQQALVDWRAIINHADGLELVKHYSSLPLWRSCSVY